MEWWIDGESYIRSVLISIQNFSKGVVVYVADDPTRAKEAEAILKHFGHANVLCYLAGMDEWEKVGGLIKYPKFVTYDVSLALRCPFLVMLLIRPAHLGEPS